MKIYFKNGLTIDVGQEEVNAINKSIEAGESVFIGLKIDNDSQDTTRIIRVDEIVYIGNNQ